MLVKTHWTGKSYRIMTGHPDISLPISLLQQSCLQPLLYSLKLLTHKQVLTKIPLQHPQLQ